MVSFSKYTGLGNDFILVDVRNSCLPDQLLNGYPPLVKVLCNRNFGIGADGIVLIFSPEDRGDVKMRIFNSDGSEAEMCGNGIRCLVKYLFTNQEIKLKNIFVIETLAGIIEAEVDNKTNIKVDMGSPTLLPSLIPTKFQSNSKGVPQGLVTIDNKQLTASAIGMGNPHMVIPVEDLNNIPFRKWGKTLEKEPSFPSHTNVHFVEIISRVKLKVLVWERGCGPTLACGTGACATLVATHLLELSDNTAEIILPGGSLYISWPDLNGSVYMSGPAQITFKGVISNELLNRF